MQTSFPVQPLLSEYSQPSASPTVRSIRPGNRSQQSATLTESSSFKFPSSNGNYQKHFEGEEIIGRGGFATVVKATHKVDRHVYAIKKLRIKEPYPENWEKALREVSTMIQFNHPGIVRYITCWVEEVDEKELSETSTFITSPSQCSQGEECQTASSCHFFYEEIPTQIQKEDLNSEDLLCEKIPVFFIQLEFCKGKTLREHLLSQNQDSIIKKLKIFAKIVLAVLALHSKGVIHRDLKPDNIFFESKTGINVKIGDFGLATNYTDRLNSQNDSNQLVQQIETEALTTEVGTRLYMSPEMKNPDATYNMKTDIYSLGIILYEILHGFNTDSERIKILDNLIKDRKFSEDFLKNYGEESKIILRMLDPSPANRPSAHELAKEINQRKKYYESQRHNKGKAIIIDENGKENMTSNPVESIFAQKSESNEDSPFLKV